jgi:hypothetical protein
MANLLFVGSITTFVGSITTFVGNITTFKKVPIEM